jgi:uncharacterized protein (DUF1697 family)
LYVGFLRAINTGKRRIKMADLRSVYEDLGYTDVATHIASGNVIFEAASSPGSPGLERAFEERFGFTSEVFLRRSDEIATIIESVVWTPDDEPVEVSFLEYTPDASDARALEATAVEPERLWVVGREVFFLRGRGRGIPTVHKEATSMRILQMKMTRRTMATVTQIHEKHILPRL